MNEGGAPPENPQPPVTRSSGVTGDGAGTRMFVIVPFVLALLALVYVAAQIVSGLAARSSWHGAPPASPVPIARSANPAAPAFNSPPAAYPAPARPKGNPAAFFGPNAYPPGALRRGEQGGVAVSLSIDADGKVSDCRVTTSSGSQALDDETCAMGRRVVFEPARGADGAAIPGQFPLHVRWVLPQG